jgi:predicted flavoprotein YhiN
VLDEVTRPRGHRSLATHLKSRLGVHGLKLALLHESLGADAMQDGARVAATLKALPLTLGAARPIDEAISSAGGVAFEALDERWMLHAAPGVFCAGEMLDWEAPTGGYLLQACLATGRAAGQGVLDWSAAGR